MTRNLFLRRFDVAAPMQLGRGVLSTAMGAKPGLKHEQVPQEAFVIPISCQMLEPGEAHPVGT